ncbi:F-box/FBD/LRR-repeat protein At1g13570-like [Ipomoea triloba]|uniref:F-box/FBD/LRR-repeat protein At1g13570-like n=1 Tax=Ipomoea triloba TaxID=35885 RepID=UPI00125D1B56|nr:F-box/FBD/LRR-repeat protein At1g13570-like [Ipomoea triloba]
MEFSRNSKRRAMEDNIFNLPGDVLNCILDHLPVRDAARTSILSRKWRYIWANHPNLVLEPKSMFGDLANSTSDDFIDTVNGILLQHIGPILTFEVKLSYVDMTHYPYVDRWILYLSRNGLRKLTLDNSSHGLYALPSYVFLCQELTHLRLSNCIFKRPCGATGSFHSLKKLSLNQVAFSPEVSASIFTASKLQHLSLTKCTGIGHLNLMAVYNHFSSWYLRRIMGITRAHLLLAMRVESFDPNERINLTSLFEHWSQISKITLDGHHLKCLAADSVTSALPVKVNNLRDLLLFGINFTDLDHISCILCLLHSSPRLNNLEIRVKVSAVTADKSPALQYLQEHICINEHINSLQTLRIKYFQGSSAQMLFVKLILACCPSLERITFVDSKVNPWNIPDILKKLLLFPRVSTKAHIVF